MPKVLSKLTHKVRGKVYGLALGLTLSLGTAALNQTCLTSGQCAACGGACMSKLPILALPVLVGGAVALLRKGRRDRMGDTS